MEKRIALKANEPVTVFVENFTKTNGAQDSGRPTQVLFQADCPLEIIKNDNLPFHRVYTTEEGQSYGGSDLRILLENYVFNALPVELKQGIKTVVNSQSAWDIDTATLVTETTHDRLWVPSHNEYFNGNSIPKDVTGRLGSGMSHSINGFGVNEMLGRSLLGNNYSYTYNSVDPTGTGHGGSSSSLYTFCDVMICFGL